MVKYLGYCVLASEQLDYSLQPHHNNDNNKNTTQVYLSQSERR